MKRARCSSPSPEPDLNVNKDWNTSPLTDTALEVEVPPAPESPLASFSLSGWRRRVPCVLKDYIPHSLVGLPHLHPTPCEPTLDEEPEVLSPASTPASDPEPDTDHDPEFMTEPNGFGLYRQYTRKPLTDPEDSLVLEDLVDDSDDLPERHDPESTAIEPETPPACSTKIEFYHPFPNESTHQSMNWYLRISGSLSGAELNNLACLISSDDFNPKTLRNFSMARELARLNKYGSTGVPFAADDNWKEGSVTLHVPSAKKKHASESESPQFSISGISYRPLLEVIKAACQSPQSKKYHWVPFKLIHQTPTMHSQAYTDIYNSDAMLEEDTRIQALERQTDDNPETEIAVLASAKNNVTCRCLAKYLSDLPPPASHLQVKTLQACAS